MKNVEYRKFSAIKYISIESPSLDVKFGISEQDIVSCVYKTIVPKVIIFILLICLTVEL